MEHHRMFLRQVKIQSIVTDAKNRRVPHFANHANKRTGLSALLLGNPPKSTFH